MTIEVKRVACCKLHGDFTCNLQHATNPVTNVHNRIESTFASLAQKGGKALIPFIMGGDPDKAGSQSILNHLPEAGADLIEIGMPFSDPMADGPVIQAAGLRALAAGVKLRDILELVRNFRKLHASVPVILMGYYNPIYHYGTERFCLDAAEAGVDGFLLVDLPPEEEAEFTAAATPHGLHLIRLIAPTTDDARLAKLTGSAGGFLYYISVTGITGGKSATVGDLQARINHLKTRTKLPVAIGFGIKTPAQAAEAAAIGDAVVVGSALVEKLCEGQEAGLAFMREVRKAMDG